VYCSNEARILCAGVGDPVDLQGKTFPEREGARLPCGFAVRVVRLHKQIVGRDFKNGGHGHDDLAVAPDIGLNIADRALAHAHQTGEFGLR
jgi:hypothetical protein